MAKQDVTGRAVTRASEIVLKIRARLEDVIPLGPDKTELTPKELQDNYQKMTPAQRELLAISQGGTDMAMEILNGTTQK